MLFTKKWIAVSLTAAILAANLTMPVTSLNVLGADITQEESLQNAAEETSDAAQTAETSAADSSESDDEALSQDSADFPESNREETEETLNSASSDLTDGQTPSEEDREDSTLNEGTANTDPEEVDTEEASTEESAEEASEDGKRSGTDAAPEQEIIAEPAQEVISEEAANSAQNGEDTIDESLVLTAEPETEIVIPTEDFGFDTNNDDVFAGYVNKELALEEDLAFDTGAIDEEADRMEKAYASTRLTGNNRTVYAILLREIKKVAAGERTNTEFAVSLSDLGLAGKYWTASDLGVDAIVKNGSISEEAMQKLNQMLGISLSDITRSLLVDCPYDLYWYDKKTGTSSSGFGYSARTVNNEYVLMFSPGNNYTFSFAVAAEYSASGELETYEVKADVGSAVKTARQTAQSIVDQNASKSDFEKMKAYKDKICDLVSYNYDAAKEDYSGSYGNPWQLIWVFDNDTSTKVVCEGYSKSFQYLCDLSSWNSIFKECISVSGVMSGGTGAGGHMWNIVTLRDGRNYLVDVTNCDDGTIGSGNSRSDLFLVGTGTDAGSTVYAQGNVSDGYYFPGLDNLAYAYNDESRNRFGNDMLTLSAGRVNASTTASGSYSGDHEHIYAPVAAVESTCKEAGHSAGGQCSICGEYDENVKPYSLKDHTPGSWTVSKQPTYDTEGQETTTCTICGSTMTRTIAKLVSETSITLNSQEATLEKGSNKQLTATVLPSNAYDKSVTWSSSNTAVATVSASGLITAVEAGTATITAATAHSGLTASCQVLVKASIKTAEVTGISGKTYTGSAQTQNPTVKLGTRTLVKDTDYTLSYSNNINAGTATLTITGTGCYFDSINKTFTIAKASIETAEVTGISGKTYTGSAQTQNPNVKLGTKTLSKDTDYTLSYSNNTNAGTASVTITGKGNYTGTINKTFTIAKASIEAAEVTGISNKTYSGSALSQAPTVKLGSKTLVNNTDYALSYSNNTNAGTASVIISGKGNYTGTINKTFTIAKASIEAAEVTGISNKTYSGSALSQAPTVKLSGKTLVKDTDYTLSYSNNTNAGTATVTITGSGNYTGSISKTFTIAKASIEAAEVSGISGKTYTGSAQTQTPTVKIGTRTLVMDTDYTLSYSNNTNAGTASITITGKGNYTGSINKTFAIAKASIASAEVAGISNKPYSGSAQTQTPTVTIGARTLAKDTDYTLSYSNNINPGTATVTITGIGNYNGTVTKTFTIEDKISVESCEIQGITNRTYNGSAQTQTLTVKLGTKTLVKDTDYALSYSNNTNAGTASVTITGTGIYTGSINKTFTIAKASIESAEVTGVSGKTYNGSAQTQNLTVKLGAKTLAKDTDYTLSYSNNTNAGNASVTINGAGNYTGTINKAFTIAKASIEAAEVTGISNKTYTGSAQTQNPTVKLGSKTLVKDTDYTLSHSNNTNAGTATVTITGSGNYTGTNSKTFTIAKASIEAAEVSGISNKTYSGFAQTQTPTVKLGSKTLVKDTDYTLSHSNNTNAGTASVTITGTGNYTGSINKTFTIGKASIASAEVTGISNKPYTGSAQTQNPTVKLGSKTLEKDTDYTLSHSNNINPGTATVTITGIGNYSGTVSKSFEIQDKVSIESCDIPDIANKTYTGSAQTPNPTVKHGTKTLVKDTDYTLSYSNNVNAGTATVIITGKGNYIGSVSKEFTIAKAAQTFTVKAAASRIDAGKTTRVTASGAKENPKFTFASSNTNIATVNASGTVTGKSAGTVTITIRSAETANYKAGTNKVSITVNKVLKQPGNCHFVKWNNSRYTSCRIGWNKVAGAEGYQTLLSWTNGSHASILNVKSNVLYRDCSVAANHVSQMKVRAFFTSNGTKKYGPWSNVEFITPSPARLTCRNVSSGADLKMKVTWNIIYGCNGYNVFVTTNPNGKWNWNQSTSISASATSAVITKCGGKLKKNTRYYVRIVTRRKRNGVFCTVPMPARNTYVGSFVIK